MANGHYLFCNVIIKLSLATGIVNRIITNHKWLTIMGGDTLGGSGDRRQGPVFIVAYF